MNNEIICRECKHFVPYYIIFKAKMKKTGFGFCSHHYLMPNERKKFPFVSACPSYEKAEVKKNEICNDVTKTLCDIRKQLSDILMMLGIEE